jgi:hypothetical protein
MTRRTRIALRFAIAAIVGASCLMVSEQAVRLQSSSLITGAEARIGRPLTPMSYAGVARRTTARVAVRGAAVGTAAVVAPRCVQVVDVYGRIVTQCY